MEVNSVVWYKDSSSNWLLGKVLSIKSEGEDIKKKKEKFSFSIQLYSLTSPFTSQNNYFQNILPSTSTSVVNIQTYRYLDSINEYEDVKLANEKDEEILSNSKLIIEKSLKEDDLISLVNLHEPSILFSLLNRFKNKKIYTLTGPVLLAINPFQDLNLYTKEQVNLYRLGGEQGSDFLNTLPPHVFRIADKAFRYLLDSQQNKNSKNQSILVSGESGAGKTETTKYIMKYLADITKSNSISNIGIEDLVLQSNPILESFGNAQTLRNDNSSRFGKFIEIHFSSDSSSSSYYPHITGATIRTYLLEKVRLVYQGEGEKNFHCFYEMLRSAPQEFLESRGLIFDGIDKKGKDRDFKKSFRYLSSSSLSKIGMIHHLSDYEEEERRYNEVTKAMKDMQFSDEEFNNIYDILASILHLGNLKFSIKNSSHGDGSSGQECEISSNNNREVGFICKLLGFDIDNLNKALCQKEIITRDEVINRSLSIAESDNIRDALSKSIYGGLFDWLVGRINISISEKNNSKKAIQYNFIGVLDIFGFENFPHNSFEQLCINYTNETLQQHFNQYIFEYEQNLYEKEGLPWTFIDYPDNKITLDLLENKREGIFALIDDSGKFQWSTQTTLYNRFNEVLIKNSRFEVNSKLKAEMKFQVNHYAGLVTYDTQGFLEKNNDILSSDLTKLLKSSKNQFLIEKIIPKLKCVDETNQATAKSFTVSSEFRRQLRELMDNISKTTPHYIRCIKPNNKGFSIDDEIKSNGKDSPFDSHLVLSQLRCCGVLEALKVARAGYPFSFDFSQFYKKFSMLSPFLKLNEKYLINYENHSDEINKLIEESNKYHGLLKNNSDSKILSESFSNLVRVYFSYHYLIKSKSYLSLKNSGNSSLLSLSDCGIAHGYRLVFLRKFSNDLLESEMIKIQKKAAIILQKYYRRFKQKLLFNLMKIQIFKLQCWYRQRKSMKILIFLRKNKASIFLQSKIRKFICQKKYKKSILSIIQIQSIYRQYKAKIKAYNLRRYISSTKISSYFRAFIQKKKYLKYRWSIVKLQVRFRMRVSRRKLLDLKAEARSLNTITKERDTLQEKVKLLEGVVSQLLSQSGSNTSLAALLSSGGDSLLSTLLQQTSPQLNKSTEPISSPSNISVLESSSSPITINNYNNNNINTNTNTNNPSQVNSPIFERKIIEEDENTTPTKNTVTSAEYQELLNEFNTLKESSKYQNIQAPNSPESISSSESTISLSSYNDLLYQFNSLKKNLNVAKRKLRMLEQKPSMPLYQYKAPSEIEFYDIYPQKTDEIDFDEQIKNDLEPSTQFNVDDIYPEVNELDDIKPSYNETVEIIKETQETESEHLVSLFDDDINDSDDISLNFQTVAGGIVIDSDDDDDSAAPRAAMAIRSAAMLADSDDESMSGNSINLNNSPIYVPDSDEETNPLPNSTNIKSINYIDSDEDEDINTFNFNSTQGDLYDTYGNNDSDEDIPPQSYKNDDDADLYDTYGNNDSDEDIPPQSYKNDDDVDLYDTYGNNDSDDNDNSRNVNEIDLINKLFNIICTNGSLDNFLELLTKISTNWNFIFLDNNSKVSLLHYASYYSHIEILEYLISQFPHQLSILTTEGWNALHFARSSKVVELLVSTNELDINLRGIDKLGSTPLSVYFFPYHVDSLISGEKKNNDENSYDSYPIYFPEPNIDLLTSLLRNGAKKSIWYRELSGLRRYPLHWAALRAIAEEVNLLINESDSPPYSELIYHPNLSHMDNSSNMEDFYPVDLLDCEGYTPLMLTTASENPKGQQLQVLMLLLSYKASPILSSLSGITPLHFIIANRKLKSRNITLPIVECILEYGGDPNARDMEGCTPVIVSIAYRLWSICQILLKHGGDLNLSCTMSCVFLRVGGNISDVIRDISWRVLQEENIISLNVKSQYPEILEKYPQLSFQEVEIFDRIKNSNFKFDFNLHSKNNQVISDVNYICGKLFSRQLNPINFFSSNESPINLSTLKDLDDDPEIKELYLKTLKVNDCCGSDLLTVNSRKMLLSHISIRQSDILSIRDRCMNCATEFTKSNVKKICIHCRRILCFNCCPNLQNLSSLPEFLSEDTELDEKGKYPLCNTCKDSLEDDTDYIVEDEF